MAKNGQKFMHYTRAEKEECIRMYQNGTPSSYFERELGIPANTIRMWQYKVNHPELHTGRKCGRQKEKDLTKEDYKERYEILKKYQAFLKEQREKK
jgi:transposase-like protein